MTTQHARAGADGPDPGATLIGAGQAPILPPTIPSRPPGVVTPIVSRTHTTRATYAVYYWNRLTPRRVARLRKNGPPNSTAATGTAWKPRATA
jgi:hypothetical protein